MGAFSGKAPSAASQHAEPAKPTAALGPGELIIGRWDHLEAEPRVSLEFIKGGLMITSHGGEEQRSSWKLIDDNTVELAFIPPGWGEAVRNRMKMQVTADELVTTNERNEIAHFKRSTGSSLAAPWKEYTSRGGGFTALFPGQPTETIDSPPGPPAHYIAYRQGEGVFKVMYVDMPASETAGGSKGVYEKMAKQNADRTKSKRDIEVAGLPGVEFVASAIEGEEVAQLRPGKQ